MIVRLIGINQSLWLDEAISANVTRNYKIFEISSSFSKSDFHPPLYYIMLTGWTKIAGDSELSLRLPSVIFSLITIYFVYLIGGIGPAALVGFNPLLVYYSQEARMYSMVTMLLVGGLYFWQKKKFLWVNVFFGLSFLTFYGSVFLMAGLTIFLLLQKKFKEAALINIGPMAAFLINWPLLNQQLQTSKELLSQVTNWSLVLGKVNLKNLLLIPMKFTSGRISFEPKIIYYVISGLWSLWVFKSMLKSLPLRNLPLTGEANTNFYQKIFWLTLGVGVLFSIFTPMMQYFRFVYLIPIMALAIKKDWIVAGGFLVFSLIYVLNPMFYREDWKSLVKDLGGKVYMIESFGDPVKYYKKDIEIVDIRSSIVGNKVTVIPYGEEIHGIDHKAILEGVGKKLVEIKSYRQLTAEVWE